MGRIDEALRRAASDLPVSAPSSSEIPRDDLFRSPWPSAGATESRSAPSIVASAPSIVAQPEVLARSTTARFRGFNPKWFDLLTVSPNVNPMLAEQFRRLAGSLHNAQVSGRLKLVMTTSAGAGDGKTMTAMNLALVLSESYGRKVLLIDADLRKPSIHDICGLRNLPGLSEGLQSATQQKLAVVQLTETLSFLPGGRPDPDPMSSLTSERMRRVLEEAAQRFDWVIIDTPPIGLVPDASLLAGMVDAALFVVRAGKTPMGQVAKAIEALGRERIFGVVLNGISEASSLEYPAYYGGQKGPSE